MPLGILQFSDMFSRETLFINIDHTEVTMYNKVEPLWPEQIRGTEVPAARPARRPRPKGARARGVSWPAQCSRLASVTVPGHLADASPGSGSGCGPEGLGFLTSRRRGGVWEAPNSSPRADSTSCRRGRAHRFKCG